MTDPREPGTPGDEPTRRPPAKGRIIAFPGARRKTSAPDRRGVVAVHRCGHGEAVVVRSLFESEGIPTFVRSHVSHVVHPFTVGEQGEVVIFVPDADAPRSRRLLMRLAPPAPRARGGAPGP
jgi:hypothetical protein